MNPRAQIDLWAARGPGSISESIRELGLGGSSSARVVDSWRGLYGLGDLGGSTNPRAVAWDLHRNHPPGGRTHPEEPREYKLRRGLGPYCSGDSYRSIPTKRISSEQSPVM